MAVNKVVFGNTTIMDISNSTLESDDELALGVTAYDRSGTLRTGTLDNSSEMTLLWTNTSTSDFGATTVSLDLSEYEMVMIYASYSASTPTIAMTSYLFKVDDDVTYRMMSGNARKDYRDLTISSTGISFQRATQVATYNNTGGNTSVNNIIVPRSIYGIKKFVIKQQEVAYPELTIKGDITPVVSGGSVTDSNLKYALTQDRTMGMFWGNMIVRGVNGTTPVTMDLNVQVEAPSSAIEINGVLVGNNNQTSLQYVPKMTIDTSGNVKLVYTCSSNNTIFALTPTLIRFSDFE